MSKHTRACVRMPAGRPWKLRSKPSRLPAASALTRRIAMSMLSRVNAALPCHGQISVEC